MHLFKRMYTHCPVCGGTFTKIQENLLTCSKCGYRLFLNGIPTASGLVVNDADQVMLVERARDPGKGKWDLPGGFIDLGESAEESLVRELQEEIGYTTKQYRYIGSYPGRYLYQNINHHILNLLYKIEVSNSERFIPADDVAGISFFQIDNIPYDEIAFPWIIKALREYFGENNPD